MEVERLVFSRELLVAGQLDTIVRDETGKYILVDWKRRVGVDFEKRKIGNVQLSLYALLWEEETQKHIEKMFLCSIFPTNEDILFHEIERDEDIKEKVHRFLELEAIKEKQQ